MTKNKIVKSDIRKRRPFIGNGMLFKNINNADGFKIDCYGLITVFWAWGFPCKRSWATAITLFDLPKGNTNLILSIKKKYTNEPKHIIPFAIEAEPADITATATVPLDHKFESEGYYELECSFVDYPNKLKIPFKVIAKEWPTFTEEEVNFSKTETDIPKKMRANVSCEDCNHSYFFEEVYDQNEPIDGGIHRFPESGEFECEECGHMLQLKDVQGQLRNLLKKNIMEAMGVE